MHTRPLLTKLQCVLILSQINLIIHSLSLRRISIHTYPLLNIHFLSQLTFSVHSSSPKSTSQYTFSLSTKLQYYCVLTLSQINLIIYTPSFIRISICTYPLPNRPLHFLFQKKLQSVLTLSQRNFNVYLHSLNKISMYTYTLSVNFNVHLHPLSAISMSTKHSLNKISL